MAEIARDDERSTPTRRTVLRGVAIAGVGLPVLAACGADDDPSGTDATTPESGSGGSADNDDGESTAAGGGDVVASKSDVPEGGGVILADDGVVVTQPTAGQFRGFSSTCTHQGCTLDNVTDGTINCICHGSMFSIQNGKVAGGPATEPLPTVPIIVAGDEISLG